MVYEIAQSMLKVSNMAIGGALKYLRICIDNSLSLKTDHCLSQK